MGRYKKLERNDLLDAAEKLIRERGAHTLSIGNVALMANVSKGGVQSNFGTRENLVNALLDRWDASLAEAIQDLRDAPNRPASELELRMQAARNANAKKPDHYAAMMALIAQSNDLRARSRDWMSQQMSGIDTSTAEGQKERLALLLNEALIVLKSLHIAPFSDEDWEDVFEDFNLTFGSAPTKGG